MDPERVRSFVSRFSFEHLLAVSRLLFEADDHLKGGGGSRPKIVLERLLFRLCDLAPNKPGGATPTPTKAGRGQTRVVSNVRTVRSGSRTGR
jgi:DNA polymerase-3 subunit delta